MKSKYNSVFWISFHAEYNLKLKNSPALRFPDCAVGSAGKNMKTVKFEKQRKSIGNQDIHLIKINFNLTTDKYFLRTIATIKEVFDNHLITPAKIYIAAQTSFSTG
ncbi:hypothetical protein AAEX28_08460 [Lentisphaerota bacterium WC36G]|nr:hypothetical protein LJT99_11315 [Lentisphaerae bacterium WC36]